MHAHLPSDSSARVFEQRRGAGGQAVLWIVGGVALLAMGAVGFALALLTQPSQLAMHGMTTVPVLLGLGALSAGIGLARTPLRVIVWPEGLRIDYPRRSMDIPWDQVGWSTVAAGIFGKRRLALYNDGGKTIAALSEGLTDFDQLVETIDAQVRSRENSPANAIRTRKARRSAVLLVGVGLLMLAGAVANVFFTLGDMRSARLLREAAVGGEAEIVRRFTAPNGVTRRIEYRLSGANGATATRNVEVDPVFWEMLADATTVPVQYVPDEPAISRLTLGEVTRDDVLDQPAARFVLSALLAALAVFLLVAGILQWRGWDIDLDSKTGKLSIKRFGEGR